MGRSHQGYQFKINVRVLAIHRVSMTRTVCTDAFLRLKQEVILDEAVLTAPSAENCEQLRATKEQ